MTIRTVHQVIGKNGSMVGEYMNIKHAKDMDNRTDVLYFVADIIEELGVDEVIAEKIAVAFLDDERRQEILARLKTVKDIPTNDEKPVLHHSIE